jgi:hypothetical protein
MSWEKTFFKGLLSTLAWGLGQTPQLSNYTNVHISSFPCLFLFLLSYLYFCFFTLCFTFILILLWNIVSISLISHLFHQVQPLPSTLPSSPICLSFCFYTVYLYCLTLGSYISGYLSPFLTRSIRGLLHSDSPMCLIYLNTCSSSHRSCLHVRYTRKLVVSQPKPHSLH